MKELNQFETYLVHEFVEDYEDGVMSRRDMIHRVLHITGGVAATATLLSHLGVTSASAQQGTPPPQPTPTGPRSSVAVAADDPRVEGKEITFEGNGATIMAYQARPSGTATPSLRGGRKAPDRPCLPREPGLDRAHPERHPALGGQWLPRLRRRPPQPRGRHRRRQRPEPDPLASYQDRPRAPCRRLPSGDHPLRHPGLR